MHLRFVLGLAAWLLLGQLAWGVPYFARKHNLRCVSCHTHPPHLNRFGLDFFARGYRVQEGTIAAHKTVPMAVWASQRLEYKNQLDLTKSFPNRIELISGGEVTDRISYFIEWRALSFETTASGTLRDRSGRFEDLFLVFRLDDTFSITTGQFRMLSQWDASRRLSLSTPLAFSGGVGGKPARSSRISSLRSFSLEGRAPALRLTAVVNPGTHPADGWYHEFTVPFAGEFSAPLTDEARRTAGFELEGQSKGVVYETYYRVGVNSVGGSFFAGDDRWMGNLTGQRQIGRHQIYGSVGTARFRNDLQDFRLSVGNYYFPDNWLALGARLDHRSADRQKPAFVPHVNFHFPGEQYTFMLVVEPFLQKNNSGVAIELSAVF